MKGLTASFTLGLVVVGFVCLVAARSFTIGAIKRTVMDQSGGVMVRAVATAKNVDTGATREMQANGSGNLPLAQLDPGRCEVAAESGGFEKTKTGWMTVAVSRVASLEFKLKVGSSEATVEVKRDAPLIEPSNPNTTTTFGACQTDGLPNPGLDLTYMADLAAGVIINAVLANVQFGAGNVQARGLPFTANNSTSDGFDTADSFTNEDLTDTDGLQLGLISIQELSLNGAFDSLDQGGWLAAAKISYTTKRGTKNLHGNAYEIRNGGAMNASNPLLNSNPGKPPKPLSNVNQFEANSVRAWVAVIFSTVVALSLLFGLFSMFYLRLKNQQADIAVWLNISLTCLGYIVGVLAGLFGVPFP